MRVLMQWEYMLQKYDFLEFIYISSFSSSFFLSFPYFLQWFSDIFLKIIFNEFSEQFIYQFQFFVIIMLFKSNATVLFDF